MKRATVIGCTMLFVMGCFMVSLEAAPAPAKDKPLTVEKGVPKPVAGKDGWVSLFNGKDFEGWKLNEKPKTFFLEDGKIVVNGDRSHLFYAGPVENANFKNFEFMADVMTMPNANSGIYIHTQFQPTGWPGIGYEVQVNQSYKPDPKKTAGLYNVVNISADENPAKDNEWYTYHIIVKGKRAIVKIITDIDGERKATTMVDYTEPENLDRKQPRLSSGTFALQGHDPGSKVYYRNILVKPLPGDGESDAGWVPLFNGKDLEGWEQLNGTAKYEVVGGTVVGTTVQGSPNSFLCTKKHYGDFVLEFEVKVDTRLNSGVQIRSSSLKEYKDGRVHGYQVEISTNGNAGRIYDEARRAVFLDEQSPDSPARKAFKDGEWNKYRVECRGDSIKTWLNDIQIVDLKDSMTAKGFIGLQVHGFGGAPPAQVAWRNIRIREL